MLAACDPFGIPSTSRWTVVATSFLRQALPDHFRNHCRRYRIQSLVALLDPDSVRLLGLPYFQDPSGPVLLPREPNVRPSVHGDLTRALFHAGSDDTA
jgi:hypothetical protein